MKQSNQWHEFRGNQNMVQTQGGQVINFGTFPFNCQTIFILIISRFTTASLLVFFEMMLPLYEGMFPVLFYNIAPFYKRRREYARRVYFLQIYSHEGGVTHPQIKILMFHHRSSF